jgi:hypothetical protein
MFPVPSLRKITSVWVVPCGVEISRGYSVAPRDMLGLSTIPQDLRHTARVIAKDNLCKSGIQRAVGSVNGRERSAPFAPQLSVSVVEAGELDPRPKELPVLATTRLLRNF